jgi:hypothetical protein
MTLQWARAIGECMISGPEKLLSQSLRTACAGLPNDAELDESEQFADILRGLEWFLPQIIYEFDPSWGDATDGICSARSRKIADLEAEVIGACWLLPDMSIEPLCCVMQIAPSTDEVSWMLCYFGEKPKPRARNREPRSIDSWMKRMYRYAYSDNRADLIDWRYKITFGERRG